MQYAPSSLTGKGGVDDLTRPTGAGTKKKKKKKKKICSTERKKPLYHLEITMIWRPNTSDTLIDTRNRLLCPLEFLSTRLLQQVGLLQDLFGLEISHADGLFSSIDVEPLEYGMLVRSRRKA